MNRQLSDSATATLVIGSLGKGTENLRKDAPDGNGWGSHCNRKAEAQAKARRCSSSCGINDQAVANNTVGRRDQAGYFAQIDAILQLRERAAL